jgi:hypothetical protein
MSHLTIQAFDAIRLDDLLVLFADLQKVYCKTVEPLMDGWCEDAQVKASLRLGDS